MEKKTWKARTKQDLIIEVWEFLDCESVGAKELVAIEEAVRAEFGDGALETPMIIARMLADEGAELRHAEILNLDVERRLEDRYDAMFRHILKFADFKQAANTLKNLENLRKKFQAENDKEGLRRLRERAIEGKRRAQMISKNPKVSKKNRQEKEEITDWFTLWLNSPEIFENWLALRLRSKDFQEKFPN